MMRIKWTFIECQHWASHCTMHFNICYLIPSTVNSSRYYYSNHFINEKTDVHGLKNTSNSTHIFNRVLWLNLGLSNTKHIHTTDRYF